MLTRRTVAASACGALATQLLNASVAGIAISQAASGAALSSSSVSHISPSSSLAAISYEVLEVGPGKRFASLTGAGCFMNSPARWNDGRAGSSVIAKMGFRVILSPGPPGYYLNDSGSQSRRWTSPIGVPRYDGNLLGPVIIEGEPGKPAPVLGTDGYADGVLHNEKGLFVTGSCDATFRNLIFRGFRRKDGMGNFAAVRLGQDSAKIAMKSQVLFEDCEFAGCDDGIMGGAVGQSLTLRRCFFHDNGNASGAVHNIYFSAGDVLTVEDTLSTRCAIGHLLKSRAAKTVVRNTRLIGDGGTESACLDVPNAGILVIDNVICEKSPLSDASWIIHYGGENQNPFHHPSSVELRKLTMVAPRVLTRHWSWLPIVGFANASGLGDAASGQGSYLVNPMCEGVAAYGLNGGNAGVPCTILHKKPNLDMQSPVRPV